MEDRMVKPHAEQLVHILRQMLRDAASEATMLRERNEQWEKAFSKLLSMARCVLCPPDPPDHHCHKTPGEETCAQCLREYTGAPQ